MILVKSAWKPRTIRIDPKDYVRIYPDCSTPRRIDLLFTRDAGCLLLDEPIANFLIGKYEGLDIDKPVETPAILPPEPEPSLDPDPTNENTPPPDPTEPPELLIDPDDYTPSEAKVRDYNDMSYSELKKLAVDRGLAKMHNPSKMDIVTALKESEKK